MKPPPEYIQVVFISQKIQTFHSLVFPGLLHHQHGPIPVATHGVTSDDVGFYRLSSWRAHFFLLKVTDKPQPLENLAALPT